MAGDSTIIAYGYDADGRRVQADVDGTVTNYLWDEYSMYGDVVMEYGVSGTPIVDYTLADGQLLAQDRGAVSYYLADAQNSTRALANGSGTITDTYSYYAFGNLYSQSGSTVNNYLYTGQQFDPLTDLYSLRARYYNPTLGRFLSRDTFPVNYRNPIELNRYGYAANNPINFSDPSGLDAVETAQLNLESFGRSDRNLKPYAVGAASLYCYVMWALGTYAGEANVCGFQAAVTDDSITVVPGFAPDIEIVKVPTRTIGFPPEIDPGLIDGSSGGSSPDEDPSGSFGTPIGISGRMGFSPEHM